MAMHEERPKKIADNLGRAVVFVIMFVFWLMLSGHFDPFHLTLGLLCSALVAFASHDLLIHKMRTKKHRLTTAMRFILYLPWLIYQVFLSNIHVAYLVLNPKKINPQVIKFKTKLTSDFSMVTLANSITLTPGTITMDIIDGEFYVHAISNKVAEDLLSGDMENRVARVYREAGVK
jgi:multicomponent Na+:H+ antiporter subunit E